MSGETSSYDQQVELKKTPNIKVDINDLLSRVRDEKKKERKENLLFSRFNWFSDSDYWYYCVSLIKYDSIQYFR